MSFGGLRENIFQRARNRELEKRRLEEVEVVCHMFNKFILKRKRGLHQELTWVKFSWFLNFSVWINYQEVCENADSQALLPTKSDVVSIKCGPSICICKTFLQEILLQII